MARWDRRGTGLPFTIYADLKAPLGSVLEARERAGDDIAVIDTAPSIGGAFHEVPHYANLIVLPATPSGPDVEALNTSYEILTGEFGHKQVGAVLTQAFGHYNITKDAVSALEALGIPLYGQIGHRTVYQVTATDGETVLGKNHVKAEEETAHLPPWPRAHPARLLLALVYTWLLLWGAHGVSQRKARAGRQHPTPDAEPLRDRAAPGRLAA